MVKRGFRVQCSGFRVEGLDRGGEERAEGLGFKVSGLGSTVQGFKV